MLPIHIPHLGHGLCILEMSLPRTVSLQPAIYLYMSTFSQFSPIGKFPRYIKLKSLLLSSGPHSRGFKESLSTKPLHNL